MIAVIPARGGSTRIPGKNIRLFHGKPIIWYSIRNAMDICDRIIVSTDSDEIAELSHAMGAEIHLRKPEFARNEVGTQAVMANVLAEKHITSGRAVCIYATAPLITSADLYNGANARGYVVSVGVEPLRDAGAFYWGNVEDFRFGVPLYNGQTGLAVLPESKVCDINTPEDWARAEQMFKVLNPAPTQDGCALIAGRP